MPGDRLRFRARLASETARRILLHGVREPDRWGSIPCAALTERVEEGSSVLLRAVRSGGA